MSSSLLAIAAVVTTVDIGTPVALNATPLLGSAGAANGGRKCKMRIPVLPLTSTCKIQTAPRIDPTTGIAPAEDSAFWTDLATLTSTSAQIQEVTPDYYVRWNTTVLDADGPNVNVYLEGVQ